MTSRGFVAAAAALVLGVLASPVSAGSLGFSTAPADHTLSVRALVITTAPVRPGPISTMTTTPATIESRISSDTYTPAPEPATLLLLGTGIALLARRLRRR